MNTKYTPEILNPIIAKSKSMRNVIRELGLKQTGGNHAHIKFIIRTFELDTSHFTGQGWLKDRLNIKARSKPDDYLRVWDNSKTVGTHSIRLRCLRDGVFEYVCARCGLSEWQNSKIPLELHHKDGDRWNNIKENIELLCPNCHAQTDNFAGKKNKLV